MNLFKITTPQCSNRNVQNMWYWMSSLVTLYVINYMSLKIQICLNNRTNTALTTDSIRRDINTVLGALKIDVNRY